MFNYSEFVTFVKGDGLARQNRFYVEMAVPSISGDYAAYWADQQNQRDMLLLCKSVNIPGVNLTTTETRTTGEVMNAPYDRNFGSATFTFYVDRQMIVRKMFDDWISAIQNPEDRTFGWYNDFISDVTTVYVMPKAETGAVYLIELHEMMPKSIGNLSLDHGSNDIMTLDVTFDYRFYKTYLNAYVPATTSSGNIDEFIYTTPAQRPLPSGAQDTYRYREPSRNEVPGLRGLPDVVSGGLSSVLTTQNAQNNNVWDTSRMVPVNPVKTLYNGYTGVAQAYSNDFRKFQSTFASGEVIYNGISIPMNISRALATIKEQALGTIKNKVAGSIFKKSRIRLKY